VAPVWLEDRSVAVTRGARFELRIGESRVPRSTLEACALDYLRRRRDTLRWVDGARIVRPKGAGH
jgi:hypothetical protein